MVVTPNNFWTPISFTAALYSISTAKFLVNLTPSRHRKNAPARHTACAHCETEHIRLRLRRRSRRRSRSASAYQRGGRTTRRLAFITCT